MKQKKRYIWQDGETYKLLETPKEVEEERKKVSYQRGYDLGKTSAIWFDREEPKIDPRQIRKFRLDANEYIKGFKEGFSDGKKEKGLPFNG